ncbi:MAG: leucine-rich repeat protein, partial [Clostridia bacterium]|nr:leucine-rich repeat protein [Clostridia bacterium]
VDADNTAYCSEDGVLFNKSKTELIQYPVGNARTSYTIPDSVTSIGDVAFLYCTSLPSVTIPDSVTRIGGAAFRGCTSLTSVTIGNSVTSIGIGAFYNCTSLTSVTIPDSVTSIEWNAFSDCTKLTSVTIPDSVTSIVNGAFSNCPALAIRGYLDSYAQQYAESNYIPFIVLNTDPFINLSGSSVTPTAEFTVYGFATPLQAVSLYCEDAVIGTATAGGNGRYTLTATLPAPEEGKTYTVVAKISVDGVDYESEPLQVTYNSDAVTLNSLVFTHSCYDYTITSETLNFVAPIISINTNRPMCFTITLNGKTSNTLTVVSTKNGVRKTMPATYNAADGKWYASGWFDTANKSYVPGEITLEYDDGKVIEVPFKAKFIVDPSGYVYEAVKSNVVEDAIAIVQYKDKNGNAAFWDADAYDQVNPQITKADGYFSWFVPEGEWQVKVKKNGYQTALSDWYTVPPEVTGLYIPLVTTSSAWVDYCNVFADYAEIKFSQYMQIDSVINGNVTFGEATGTWEAVDKEVSGTDENVYYATTFRFTPDTAFSGDVTVNIANVTNYAGIIAYSYSPYTETVTVTAPIENFTLSATALTIVTGTQATVELDAGAAAAGKTVSVQFGNEAVASAVKTVTLDKNGKASLTVNGNAFGATTATFALAGTSLTAECTVTVTAPTAVEPAFTLGDVDNNGKLEAADARLALRAAVKLETLTETQTKAADADKNGKLEAADARLILRAAVGLETL